MQVNDSVIRVEKERCLWNILSQDLTLSQIAWGLAQNLEGLLSQDARCSHRPHLVSSLLRRWNSAAPPCVGSGWTPGHASSVWSKVWLRRQSSRAAVHDKVLIYSSWIPNSLQLSSQEVKRCHLDGLFLALISSGSHLPLFQPAGRADGASWRRSTTSGKWR